MTKQRRRLFVLTLQPVRSDSNVIHALRAILKALLRRYGWRCIAAQEVSKTHAHASPPALRGPFLGGK